VVNIDKLECSCRKWSISGLPCCHALSAMKFLNLQGEDFIGHWFRTSTYEETYNSVIFPINGQEVWEVTAYPDVLPPTKRIMPGRPKKKRRLEPWELRKDDTTLRKGGIRKRCAVCREIGHNKTACPKTPTSPSAHSTQTSIAAIQTQPRQGQSQRASNNQFVQPMRNKLQARRGRIWKP